MRISVIIPAHDAAKTVERTLRSVFAETRAPDEVVVVDDGSTDGTRDALRPFADRVTLVATPMRGAAAARNAGARIATGDALFLCDADIELAPTALAALADALEREPDAAFAYCRFEWHGRIFADRPFDPDALRGNNYISTMSLIRRSAFPGFDESLPRFQDWDLWLTVIARGGKGIHVPETLFRVIEEGSMSRRGGLSRLRATARVRAKHRLPWRLSDFWLALKESVKARRV